MNDKIQELENKIQNLDIRISTIEKKNKRSKIFKIISFSIGIITVIIISILYYYYFKTFTTSIDSFF